MQRGYGVCATFHLLTLCAPADRARLATGRRALRVATVNASQAATWPGAIIELFCRKGPLRLPLFAE